MLNLILLALMAQEKPMPGITPEQAEKLATRESVIQRLEVARVQARFYATLARRAAVIQEIDADLARLRAEYEKLLKADPNFKRGCEYDENQELKCPTK